MIVEVVADNGSFAAIGTFLAESPWLRDLSKSCCILDTGVSIVLARAPLSNKNYDDTKIQSIYSICYMLSVQRRECNETGDRYGLRIVQLQ